MTDFDNLIQKRITGCAYLHRLNRTTVFVKLNGRVPKKLGVWKERFSR